MFPFCLTVLITFKWCSDDRFYITFDLGTVTLLSDFHIMKYSCAVTQASFRFMVYSSSRMKILSAIITVTIKLSFECACLF